MKELYEKNAEFRGYVDRFCIGRGMQVKDALQLAIIKEVGNYYKKAHR